MSPNATTDDTTRPPPAEQGSGENGHRSAAFSRDLGALLAELREYVTYFIAAKTDGIKASIRNIAVYAVLGLLGLFIAGTVLLTATILFVIGIADGIGAIFEPDRPFAGKLIVGGVVLGGLAAGALIFLKRFKGSSRKRSIEKYESLQQTQHAHYGRDVQHFD